MENYGYSHFLSPSHKRGDTVGVEGELLWGNCNRHFSCKTARHQIPTQLPLKISVPSKPPLCNHVPWSYWFVISKVSQGPHGLLPGFSTLEPSSAMWWGARFMHKPPEDPWRMYFNALGYPSQTIRGYQLFIWHITGGRTVIIFFHWRALAQVTWSRDVGSIPIFV